MRTPPPGVALVAAYEATEYRVDSRPPHTLMVGQDVASVRAWLKRQSASSATIVTAWNPFSGQQDAATNDIRQTRLRHAVEQSGLRWMPAQGCDASGQWPSEPSYCVLDAPHVLIDSWLSEYEQYAVLQACVERGCRLIWHPDVRSPHGST